VDVFVRSTSRERVLLEAVTRGCVELEASTNFGTVGHCSSQLPVDRVIEVGVADSGVGIPAEHLRRIFDPFYPVDRRLTREGEGLGLPICQEIIRLHGGLMWAESAAGAGSSFHMLLPQRYEQAAAAAIPAVRVLPH
jgi:signal transduction histidine kinase